MKKTLRLIISASALTLTLGMTALASPSYGSGTDDSGKEGMWIKLYMNETNYWGWLYKDRTYASGWTWIDDNEDGIAECYFFDNNGLIVTSKTTDDGYQVNEDGAWVVDGVIQTKSVEYQEAEDANPAEPYLDNGGYNEWGVSNSVVEMLSNSREENNQKFGVVHVAEGYYANQVEYANGIIVGYETTNMNGTSDLSRSIYKSYSRTDFDYDYFFQYFEPGLYDEQVRQKLISLGFRETVWNSSEAGTFAINPYGGSCSIRTPGVGLRWDTLSNVIPQDNLVVSKISN